MGKQSIKPNVEWVSFQVPEKLMGPGASMSLVDNPFYTGETQSEEMGINNTASYQIDS